MFNESFSRHYYRHFEYLFKLDENYLIQPQKTLRKSVGSIWQQKIINVVTIEHQAVSCCYDYDNLLIFNTSCQIKVEKNLKICQTFSCRKL